MKKKDTSIGFFLILLILSCCLFSMILIVMYYAGESTVKDVKITSLEADTPSSSFKFGIQDYAVKGNIKNVSPNRLNITLRVNFYKDEAKTDLLETAQVEFINVTPQEEKPFKVNSHEDFKSYTTEVTEAKEL